MLLGNLMMELVGDFHIYWQAVMERQQRHGFCVSADLSRQLAATTVRLIGSANAADLEAGAGRWQQGGSVAGHRCRVRRGGGRPA